MPKIIAQREYSHPKPTSAGNVMFTFTVDVYRETDHFIIHEPLRPTSTFGKYVVSHKVSGYTYIGFNTIKECMVFIKEIEALPLPWDTFTTLENMQAHYQMINDVRKKYVWWK